MADKQRVALVLRTANLEDCGTLAAIYAPYVEGTAVSFEYTAPSAAVFRHRMEVVMAFYPYLVAEQGGKVVGFAYAHRHAERAAFDWNAELSVYLLPEACGQGVGRALYQALMELLQGQGVCNVYGLVCSPNPASERLHEALGFSLAGTWHLTGYKFGRWHDLLLYEKALAPAPAAGGPLPPRAFHSLPMAWVQAVLQRNSVSRTVSA